MKQTFTHRLPSPVTLLSDPWPENLIEVRSRIANLRKAVAQSITEKTGRLPGRRNAVQSPLK